VIVPRRADRLQHEDVAATDVLVDLDEDLTVAERADFGGTELNAESRATDAANAGLEFPAKRISSSLACLLI